MKPSTFSVNNAEQTAQLLSFPRLIRQISKACTELAAGKIHAPERQVVNFPQGGVMLSMPATASDIGIHKLVNVVPANAGRGLPTIHGTVSAYDGKTGRELFLLDGPTLTARRTAALSLLGLQVFLRGKPRHVSLIGYGKQASGHLAGLAEIYPDLKVTVTGRNIDKANAFIAAHSHLPLRLDAATAVPESSDVVITLTTSATPVYTLPATAARLVIAVGAFKPELVEISATTLSGSVLYTDDLAGARHEAGDFIQGNVDWGKVIPLASALSTPPDLSRPIVFKTVGCAAWDLAAARCALEAMANGSID